MKGILISILFFSVLANAQTEYPWLNLNGISAESFVPPGWSLISKTEGDLNKDQLNDLAIVVEKADSYEIDGETKTNTLRILGIFLKQKNGSYIKHTQSNTFIISRKNENNFEPFQGLSVTNEGYLEILFQHWTADAVWFVTIHSYKFTLQNNKFELVQYNTNETDRNTGESTDISVDFVAKKKHIYISNYLTDVTPQEETIKFKLDALKSFQTMEIPFKWEFIGMVM